MATQTIRRKSKPILSWIELSFLRITLDHHRRRLEDGIGDLRNTQLFMIGLLSRDDRGVGGQHEMNAPEKDVEVAITKW